METGKLTRVLSVSALQCCETLHIYPKEKKKKKKTTKEYTAELSISTNFFSQRHTISNGHYLTNPQTPYRIKQIASSSPKRTKQAEFDFRPAAG